MLSLASAVTEAVCKGKGEGRPSSSRDMAEST